MQNFGYSGNMNSWRGSAGQRSNNMSMSVSRRRPMYQNDDIFEMDSGNSRQRFDQMEDRYQNDIYDNNGDVYMTPINQNIPGRSPMMNSRFHNNQFDFEDDYPQGQVGYYDDDMNMYGGGGGSGNWRNRRRYDDEMIDMRRQPGFSRRSGRVLGPQSRTNFKKNTNQKSNHSRNFKSGRSRATARKPNFSKDKDKKVEKTQDGTKKEGDTSNEKKESEDGTNAHDKSQSQVTSQQSHSGRSQTDVSGHTDIPVKCQICHTTHANYSDFRNHLGLVNHMRNCEKIIKKCVFTAGKLLEQMKFVNNKKVNRGARFCRVCGCKYKNPLLHKWNLSHQMLVFRDYMITTKNSGISIDQLMIIDETVRCKTSGKVEDLNTSADNSGVAEKITENSEIVENITDNSEITDSNAENSKVAENNTENSESKVAENITQLINNTENSESKIAENNTENSESKVAENNTKNSESKVAENNTENSESKVAENNTENSESKAEENSKNNDAVKKTKREIFKEAKYKKIKDQQVETDELISKIKKYEMEARWKPIGKDNIMSVSGCFCKVCKVFFSSENDGDTLHCMSKKHRENHQKKLNKIKLQEELKEKKRQDEIKEKKRQEEIKEKKQQEVLSNNEINGHLPSEDNPKMESDEVVEEDQADHDVPADDDVPVDGNDQPMENGSTEALDTASPMESKAEA